MNEKLTKLLTGALNDQNQLLIQLSELLADTIKIQNKDMRPKEIDLEQLFAQALELWSCDIGGPIPDRFRQLQDELLPDPVWEDEQVDDPSERVVDEILAERQRQIAQEKWTPEHDDSRHNGGQLSRAAACYAVAPDDIIWHGRQNVWPWSNIFDKRENHSVRRCRVIAAALLVAEIERMDRKDRKEKR